MSDKQKKIKVQIHKEMKQSDSFNQLSGKYFQLYVNFSTTSAVRLKAGIYMYVCIYITLNLIKT